ncbi:MAG: bifunctional UDP-N-acetylglucosamine diphosphorylase/glucosamine-1-phosphate N-acetyltransferase GlmU [Brucellaceae bacterium]|nr:bifunctional UDP-N-acetylglucosamine diphosphorylase/glucosamine-1-phosphate N-acetyltransferase GlmU [Brucellaceae bacterium]
MTDRTCLTVILAAGEGTRMKSGTPKVLHTIAGREMVRHVAEAAAAVGSTDVAVVTGPGAETVADAVRDIVPGASVHVQTERLGTAHAVLAAREAIARGYDDVLILYGDTPLVRPEALAPALEELANGASVAVIGFRTDDPTGYGRLIEAHGELLAIREHKDATEEERQITYCNGGLMAVAGAHALALLDAVGNANAKGEYYLTDVVEIARSRRMKVVATEVDVTDVIGVNTLSELAAAERIWQERRRAELMGAGVVMTAPETVFLSADTEIAPGVAIEPNVFFGPGVTVGAGAKLRAFSHIEGAAIAAKAEIGPFARLRPGADIAEKAKVGNFCEVKNATVEAGAKINHLSYIGDAFVGAGANVGAGTITCNYDGFLKHRTHIGAGAFIGSNSALVAPVTIGDGGYVASGSVITDDVPVDALALGRARQVVKEGRGAELRERLAAEKARRKGG